MKKTILAALMFVSAGAASAYFDGGLNHVSGTDGYSGQDAYLMIGFDNFWVKPEYSAYKADNLSTYRKYSARVGFEKDLYTLSILAGMTPEADNYKNKFAGADITFSINPASGSKKRMAGPNSGYGSRSGEGVTQIDLGAGLVYTAHTANDKDLAQLDASLFAAVKVLMAQISTGYTASSYDKTMSLANVGGTLVRSQRVSGLSSYLVGYPKSNVNVKVDLVGAPMVTPFVSYNKTKFELASVDDLSAYGLGAYIDLNMVGATVAYQTYKIGDDRSSFLSVSAGVRF